LSDTINGAETGEWFLTESGQRKGPLSAAALLELLQTQKVNGDTLVWRKGLSEWQPLRATELGVHLQNSPPPVVSSEINNGLVWTLALAPIAYTFLAAYRNVQIYQFPYEDHTLIKLATFAVPAIINAAICLLDEQQLKRAGYADKWLTIFGIFFAPAYLFLRAKRLKQRPYYGFVWIVVFIIGTYLIGTDHP
jgi:hypothetical protein